MHRDHSIVRFGRRELTGVEVNPFRPTAMSLREFAASAVDQNPPHRLCGGREELSAVLEARLGATHEPQLDFMHEGSGLQCLSRRFARHAKRRQTAQFSVYEHQQFFGGRRVALLDGRQQ